jgi:hypothetical protein
MRIQLAVALLLSLAAVACGSSQTSGESSSGQGSSGSSEPIVVADPQPSSGGNVVEGSDACTTDADCVPAACCHAAACVAQANAPTCADVMCTADCQGGTIDCGGGCLCQNGHCAARLWQPEQPSVSPQ